MCNPINGCICGSNNKQPDEKEKERQKKKWVVETFPNFYPIPKHCTVG